MLRYHGARSAATGASTGPRRIAGDPVIMPMSSTKLPLSTPTRKVVGPPGVARASVRLVAAWEAVKGVLVLLAGGLAVYFLRPDQERSIEEIVGHFHLNPAGHTSHIFQRALEHIQDTRLVLLASGALLYALLRFVEAYGLWAEKRWGWMLGIASSGIYLPLEVMELVKRFTWTSVCLLVVNLVIIAVLWHNRTHHVGAA
jgi:uncharacterized membrane protein (DUF2068 family)